MLRRLGTMVPPEGTGCSHWLRRWLALSALVLIAATGPLWTPQQHFPQVPFLAALRNAPPVIDWLALITLVASLVWLLFAPSAPNERQNTPTAGQRINLLRAGTTMLVIALVVLVLLNQHRFQPWAYQFGLALFVIGFAPSAQAVSRLRLLTIAIYFWSAVSKLDHSFLHETGPLLLRGLLTALTLPVGWFEPTTAITLSLAFPMGELAVALLLIARRTRVWGLMASLLMHFLLLLTLGPLGLNHEPGVLLWNLYFIGQNLLLFPRWADAAVSPETPSRTNSLFSSPPPEQPDLEAVAAAARRQRDRSRASATSAWGPRAAITVAVLLPALEPFDRLDHWPAWALYAPGAERVTLLIDEAATHRLPPEVQRHLGPADLVTQRRVLRLDLWSFEALSAPLYPQGRFRTGVALGVVERSGLHDAARLIVDRRANRFSGERTRSEYVGGDALRRYAESFWLNALPRPVAP